MNTSEIIAKVNEQIFSKLESAGSWQKLWEMPRPISINEYPYQGINFLLLVTSDHEYPIFGTYLQLRENGGIIKQGEKSQLIVYWDKFTPDPTVDDPDPKKKFFLKVYHVFNIQQATFDSVGMQKIESLKTRTNLLLHSRDTDIETFVASLRNLPKIITDRSIPNPGYDRHGDQIIMPDIRSFQTTDEYYMALFHEIIHSTAHKSRLDRFNDADLDGDSKRYRYSKEELVAEMGAAYLAHIAGIKQPDIENCAAYIKGWQKAIQDNATWLVWAANKAQTAINYLLNIEADRKAA